MSNVETWFLRLLLLQILLGAYDTVVHHELLAKLPGRRNAVAELTVHATRSALYGILFLVFAHLRPTGIALGLVWVVIAIEVVLTLIDFRIEDRTRTLPPAERSLHNLLGINAGAMFALYAWTTAGDWGSASGFARVDRGCYAWALDLGALGILLSAGRDALAARALRAKPPAMPLWADAGPKSLLVAGATGFIGTAVTEGLLAAGHRITALARDPRRAAAEFDGRIRAVASVDDLRADERFDAIVHLAGAAVVGPPWTAARKRELRASRIGVIAELARFCDRAVAKPEVWIQASAIGLYGYRGESSPEVEGIAAQPGDFASALCADLEVALPAAPGVVTRRVILRLGIVLDRWGGVLPPMALANALGAGAVLGDGAQAFAWIHLDDVLGFVDRALADPAIRGPYNLVAPEAVSQRQLADGMARIARRPRLIAVPAFVLRLALGEMARLLLEGPRVEPRRLVELGFDYRHPTLASALAAALGRPLPSARSSS